MDIEYKPSPTRVHLDDPAESVTSDQMVPLKKVSLFVLVLYPINPAAGGVFKALVTCGNLNPSLAPPAPPLYTIDQRSILLPSLTVKLPLRLVLLFRVMLPVVAPPSA